MKTINVGLIGFGTVGRSVVKALLAKKKILEDRTGISINLAKICDKDLRPRPGVRVPRKLLTNNVDNIIKDKRIDIVVELIGGVHPAKEIILRSFALGKHVVTANKALLAEHGKEIFTAASRYRSNIGFGASVGGGIPVISVLKNSLLSNNISTLYGILNGTSNFILTKMSEENCSFEDALFKAQKIGLAERNPKLDTQGIDSCHKLAILALLGFGKTLKPKDIYVEGIEDVEPIDIEYAKVLGYALKLLVIAKKIGNELDLRVHPTLIPQTAVLANVKDENNAIFIKGDMIGDALLYGKGAGSLPAASTVVSDIVETAKNIGDLRDKKPPFNYEFSSGIRNVRDINSLITRYYLRFSAIDKPGVLAGISGVLAKNKISIATVTQKERKRGKAVPIVMLTHDACEGSMNRALYEIDKLAYIAEKTVRLRIES